MILCENKSLVLMGVPIESNFETLLVNKQITKMSLKPRVVKHTCNPSTGQAEVGGL
jgi:hypothetical protein